MPEPSVDPLAMAAVKLVRLACEDDLAPLLVAARVVQREVAQGLEPDDVVSRLMAAVAVGMGCVALGGPSGVIDRFSLVHRSAS